MRIPTRKTKIMIVDSDKEFCKELLNKLTLSGYVELTSANYSNDALFMIARNCPDIILLDAWIGNDDYTTFIKDVRAMSGFSNRITIIVTSVVFDNNIFCEALEAGADFCMHKPIDYNALLDRIERVMRNNRFINSSSDKSVKDLDLESQVSKTLRNIGIPAHLKGYYYLRTAILILIENSDMHNNITKYLYPEIARIYSTTSSRVERAMRHAIELAFCRGNIDILNEYFGYSINSDKGKASNSEFIATIADRLRIDCLCV